jgi:hypothetical protein
VVKGSATAISQESVDLLKQDDRGDHVEIEAAMRCELDLEAV